MNKRVLLVEDDPNLGFVIQDTLENNDFDVILCADGEEGLNRFEHQHFDICLLDIMLPKQDGINLAKHIREINSEVPIIFLTAKSMIEDKVDAFQSGGDDYLTKPFNIEELLLRINAVLKRQNKVGKVPDEMVVGDYKFNYANLELLCSTETKVLTKKEADLLKILCLHKNEVLEREKVLKAVWGEDDYFLGRSMDVFISRLRKYLRHDKNIEIQNIHGVGFKFVVKTNSI